MQTISLDENEIGKRRTKIPAIVRPLVGRPRPIVQLAASPFDITLYLHPRSDIRGVEDARQRTDREGMFLNFFEIWRRDEKTGSFVLYRFYLNLIFEPDTQAARREVFAFHSDCDLEVSQNSELYRRSPHLHIGFSGDKSLHKAHIALCLMSADAVFEGIDAFDSACSRIVEMLNDEIIVRGLYL